MEAQKIGHSPSKPRARATEIMIEERRTNP